MGSGGLCSASLNACAAKVQFRSESHAACPAEASLPLLVAKVLLALVVAGCAKRCPKGQANESVRKPARQAYTHSVCAMSAAQHFHSIVYKGRGESELQGADPHRVCLC
eukprot:364938-Chlamydomonas_euryale.AAC.44